MKALYLLIKQLHVQVKLSLSEILSNTVLFQVLSIASFYLEIWNRRVCRKFAPRQRREPAFLHPGSVSIVISCPGR